MQNVIIQTQQANIPCTFMLLHLLWKWNQASKIQNLRSFKFICEVSYQVQECIISFFNKAELFSTEIQ